MDDTSPVELAALRAALRLQLAIHDQLAVRLDRVHRLLVLWEEGADDLTTLQAIKQIVNQHRL